MMKTTKAKFRKNFTDEEFIRGLMDGNECVTYAFFYSLCSFTINDIRWSLMGYKVDYDEMVNELYIYLSEDNWRRLSTFAGRNDCSLKSWMVKIAWRFFLRRKGYLLSDVPENEYPMIDDSVNDVLRAEMAMDIESTFSRMTCRRYVQVLTWMLGEGRDAEEVAEMLNTTVTNIYNIKHRAIKKFIETYTR